MSREFTDSELNQIKAHFPDAHTIEQDMSYGVVLKDKEGHIDMNNWLTFEKAEALLSPPTLGVNVQEKINLSEKLG